jgi:glycine/D-amino acid oxidase-like deaminating enzyme
MPPAKVEDVLGKEAGSKLNRILASAPDLVFSLIEKNNIRCEPIRSGTLHCAQSGKGVNDLENRYQQLIDRKAPVELLNQIDTCKRTGTDNFHASLFDPRAGTIQPLAYCLGLARAAIKSGAKINESTRAYSIKLISNQWHVKTANGMIRASALLVATNAYHQEINGMKHTSFTPLHFFQLATKPLAKDIEEPILPGSEGCWDTAPIMTAFRIDAAGRLILGAIGNLGHGASSIHINWARRKLNSLFPNVCHIPFEYSWHGRIAMTSDHVPKVLKLDENAYSIHGFSGRGIGPGTVFGKAVVDCLMANNENILPVAAINRHNQHFSMLNKNLIEVAASAVHFFEER